MEKYNPIAILHNFCIASKTYQIKPINQGFINDTYLVLEHSVPSYILQRINTDVFTNVRGLMNNLEKALEYLHADDYSRIMLVKTHSATNYHRTPEGGCWRLMSYIDKSTAYDTTTDLNIAFEAGRIISKFHDLLQAAPIHEFVETIPRFHDLELRENQFNAALELADEGLKVKAGYAIEFARTTLAALKNWNQGDVPERLCHNDTKLNNILFEKDSNKALCLIDLDTFMKGYFHYDFGDAVRTIVNTAPEDEKDHQKITFDRKLFEVFVKGLHTNAKFLTSQEKRLLPFGAILLPFLHGIRALTDYLSGNVYYKVAYENQNLDRCLSLFDFTQKATDNITFMEAVITREMGD